MVEGGDAGGPTATHHGWQQVGDGDVNANDGPQESADGMWDDVGPGFSSDALPAHVTNRGDVWQIPDEPEGAWISWDTLLAYLGPGFLMCIAYLDPGNLEADLQTGAYTGYQLIWVLLLAHMFGLLLQSMASRLGVVTGNHLAGIARLNYKRPASLLLWLMAELAIIGSDIQEVLGSAIALQILTGVPLWAGCVITAVDTFTFLFMHVFGVRKLEGLFVVLVATMTVTFFINYASEPPAAIEVLKGFQPKITSHTSVTALGLLGAVIMPHNLYLHSALVLSRRIGRDNKRKVWEAVKYCTIDSALALGLAFLINLAVVGTFAVQFYSVDCINTRMPTACLTLGSIDRDSPTFGTCAKGLGVCQEIGLGHAGDALRGSLGSNAKYVWAIGLLAAGQSSTMTGTYAGQFVMEGFLQLSIAQWQRVMLTRTIALGPALLVTVLMHGKGTATDRLSEWLNVLQSVQLPFALIPLVHFCGSKRLMGEFTVGRSMTALLWVLTIGMIGINLYTVLDFFFDDDAPKESTTISSRIMIFTVGTLYLSFCLYLMWEDLLRLGRFIKRIVNRCIVGDRGAIVATDEDDGGVSLSRPTSFRAAIHHRIEDEEPDDDDPTTGSATVSPLATGR
eukprot:TRINITY_DN31192_c0_g1_i1.p1 TRINITY_DN31192_c0_g1~~TRINITY_DN31192_c0_g1_i1.p1  ORF type:complete len:658 (+),score=140.42 TRINITY_DN31192_c0_g1_i1:114-1976(+)